MRRALDVAVSCMVLALAAPVLLLLMAAIFLQDGHGPLFAGERVGRGGKPFRMLKLRSMIWGAERTRVDSTAASDPRITRLGHFIRRCKFDELLQFWNVLRGEMSLVGPRPNVPREVARYTPVERGLLEVQPGITDMASIVFSDEGLILELYSDPDLAYNQFIRPWKSRLALFNLRHRTLGLDLRLVYLTFLSLFSRSRALQGVHNLIRHHGGDPQLQDIALRTTPLPMAPPPGSSRIVTRRN